MENVNELMEQYEYLVPITLMKMFGNVEVYAKSKKIEPDDLYQYGLMGMWYGITSYPQKQIGTLRNYIIRNIKWYVNKSVRKEMTRFLYYRDVNNKYIDVNYEVPLMSMSKKIDPEIDTDYYETIATDNIYQFTPPLVENEVLSNIRCKEYLSILKPKDREIVNLRFENGLSFEEIAKIYNVRKQAVAQRFNRIKEIILEYIENEKKGINHKIVQLTPKGKIVKIYNNIHEAVASIDNARRFNIERSCNEEGKTAYGYEWMFLNDYKKLKRFMENAV